MTAIRAALVKSKPDHPTPDALFTELAMPAYPFGSTMYATCKEELLALADDDIVALSDEVEEKWDAAEKAWEELVRPLDS